MTMGESSDLRKCQGEKGPIGSPETSIFTHLTPCKYPEEGRIQFNRGGNPRLRSVTPVIFCHCISDVFVCDVQIFVTHARTHARTNLISLSVVYVKELFSWFLELPVICA